MKKCGLLSSKHVTTLIRNKNRIAEFFTPDNLHISTVHLVQDTLACSVPELPRAPVWPQLQLLLLLQQLRCFLSQMELQPLIFQL